jgi:hypothetical protein
MNLVEHIIPQNKHTSLIYSELLFVNINYCLFVLLCEEIEGFDVVVGLGDVVLFTILIDGTVLFHVLAGVDELDEEELEVDVDTNVDVGVNVEEEEEEELDVDASVDASVDVGVKVGAGTDNEVDENADNDDCDDESDGIDSTLRT